MKKLVIGILIAVFCCMPQVYCSLYMEDESDTFIPAGEGDWYFDLTLEPEYAQKFEKAYYYPEQRRLSLIYKQGQRDTSKISSKVRWMPAEQKFIKERTDIFVQSGEKPTGKSIKVYGYYQQKDPLTGKQMSTKNWVFKIKKEQSE